MYRMKQFSAMTGMTQSKIRFYEKHGLVLSDRMENGYRVFTPEDAFRANAPRVLLQHGFSINEAVAMLDKKQDTPDFRKALENQRQRMEREREPLNYRLKRIQATLELVSSDSEPDFKVVEGSPQLYINASHGRDFSVSEDNAKVLAEYYKLGVTSCARIIRRSDLLGKGSTVDPQLCRPHRRKGRALSERLFACPREGWNLGTCVASEERSRARGA